MRAKNLTPKERDDQQRREKTCKLYEQLVAGGMEPSKAKMETAYRTGQSLTTVYKHLKRASKAKEEAKEEA